jgi:hypothetical protein
MTTNIVQDRKLDRDTPRRTDKRWTVVRRRIDDGLNRIRRIWALNRNHVRNPSKATLDFFLRVPAPELDKPGNFPFEAIELHVGYRGAFYTPDLMAHHDAPEKIAQGGRPGIMPADLITVRELSVHFSVTAKCTF